MEVSGQLHAPATLLSWKEPVVSIVQEAGWGLESVWTLWRKERSLGPTGNRTPAVPVAIPIELSRLVAFMYKMVLSREVKE
jgi:hypothetical protein